jgi:hypothetical protein
LHAFLVGVTTGGDDQSRGVAQLLLQARGGLAAVAVLA